MCWMGSIIYFVLFVLLLGGLASLYIKYKDKKRYKRYSRLAKEQEFSVAVIGAGFAGLGIAVHLKRSGIPFIILEKATEVGGTWNYNKYPGCACDIPSHLYSFSFLPNPKWSRAYPTQPEILEYLKSCARIFDLYKDTKFNSEVISSSWDPDISKWAIKLKSGDTIKVNIIISGQGILHVPNYATFPGRETFKGKILHTAEWDPTYNIKGKSVGIIGSAASAIQAIPVIAKKASKLFVFQRTANWIVPKLDGEYSSIAKYMLHVPLFSSTLRWLYYWRQEIIYFLIFQNPDLVTARLLRKALKVLIKRKVKDEKLAERLTPKYHVGCKRILISNDFYPAMCQENVSVESSPIKRIFRNGIITGVDGEAEKQVELDVIIYATGFQVLVGFPPVYCSNNRDLISDIWGNNPSAYLPDYPNFFFLLGPNTALGHNSVVWMIECQAEYIMKIICKMLDNNIKSVDTNRTHYDAYQQNIVKSLENKVWSRKYCNNWYQNDSGSIFTLWPSSTLSYWKSTLFPSWDHFIFTK